MEQTHAHDAGRASRTVGTYACPMHPEVRREGPGRCPTCGMSLEPIRPDGEAWKKRATIAACVFLAIVAFFLWTEHRAHLLGALPYVLLLLCPIIHLFMHRRHGGGGHAAHGHQTGPGGRP